METIHIRQRLRPLRMGFVISPGDEGAALQAVSLNTALWGGIYNPIVALGCDGGGDGEGLLEAFDVDILVNLTGATLTGQRFASFRDRIIESGNLVKRDHITDERTLSIGFDVLPILRQIYHQEIRFSQGETRAALIEPDDGSEWIALLAIHHGSYRWLPQLDVDYEGLYVRDLRARAIPASDSTPPVEFEHLVGPLGLTRHGLKTYGAGGLRCSSHIIFVGNHRSLGDMLNFWNIRATGRRAVFVPVAAFQAFERVVRSIAMDGSYPYNRHIRNRPELQKGLAVDAADFGRVSDWAGSLNLGDIVRRDWRPRYDLSAPNGPDIGVGEVEARESEELSVFHDGKLTPVKAIVPPYVPNGEVATGDREWAVDITTIGPPRELDWMFAYPREPEVEVTVRWHSSITVSGPIRIGRHSLVLTKDSAPSTLYFTPVPTKEVIHAIFRQGGIHAEPSVPGQHAEQIIRKMGTVNGDCRIFKLQGVRDLFDHLGLGKASLTKGNIREYIRNREVDGSKNWRDDLYEDLILRRGQKRGADPFETILDIMLEKRVLRPGFEFKCSECYKADWYHVSEFTEQYTCRYCFKAQRVDFASKRDWQYRSDGLFQIPDGAQGSIGVILSLWFFDQFASTKSAHFVTSRNLKVEATGSRCEIDYAYLVMREFDTSYDIVLGQVGRRGDFKDQDMKIMSDLADRLPRRPFLAFSTMREQFSEEDKIRLRGLIEKGYRLIALTREELDPYEPRSFDRAPYPHPVSLAELSKNTVFLNLGRSGETDSPLLKTASA